MYIKLYARLNINGKTLNISFDPYDNILTYVLVGLNECKFKFERIL